MFVSTAATQSACPTQCHTSTTHNQRHASVTAGAVRIVYSSFKARLRRAGLSGPGRAPSRLVLEEHDQRGILAAADLPAVVAEQLLTMHQVIKTAVNVRDNADKVVTGLVSMHGTLTLLLEQAQGALRGAEAQTASAQPAA